MIIMYQVLKFLDVLFTLLYTGFPLIAVFNCLTKGAGSVYFSYCDCLYKCSKAQQHGSWDNTRSNHKVDIKLPRKHNRQSKHGRRQNLEFLPELKDRYFTMPSYNFELYFCVYGLSFCLISQLSTLFCKEDNYPWQNLLHPGSLLPLPDTLLTYTEDLS